MKIIKEFIYVIGVISGIILMATVLLVAVYALPTGRIKENVAKSSQIFDKEEAYPELIPGYKFTRLDNFTDSIMLAIAMYDGEESTSEKAMANYRMRSDELGVVKSTTHYANDVQAEYYVHPYQRYWHGYLIYLKPLLVFFTYGEIRILNGIFQMIMAMLIIKKMYSSMLRKYIPAYIMMALFINPSVVALSLQYSAIYNLILFFILLWLILIQKKKVMVSNVWKLFLVAGCITSYIDFLTYPIVLVGVLCVLTINTFGCDWKNLLFLIRNIGLWGIGYIGMWAGKWLVGSIILKENLFMNAIEKLMFRTSMPQGCENRTAAIWENIVIYGNEIFIILLMGMIVFAVCNLWKKGIKVKRKNICEIIAYVLVGIMPFAWMLLAAEHSKEHAWFVHRGFAITVLAISCIYEYIKENCCISCEK